MIKPMKTVLLAILLLAACDRSPTRALESLGLGDPVVNGAAKCTREAYGMCPIPYGPERAMAVCLRYWLAKHCDSHTLPTVAPVDRDGAGLTDDERQRYEAAREFRSFVEFHRRAGHEKSRAP